ncbi:MAG: thiamine pyrophosphate-dependent enzyme [Acidimicrobiia bacterium]|nr:thiamine pyrophosphate-dependent enzyme [Acidimicrobiia bacterium]MDH3470543.1 thiamine pyrophosphate-dependent enzyme [Acidimicrobiia bacterium]
MTDTTITPLSGYRNDTPYPFCPGCGHGSILDELNTALSDLSLDPAEVVIVSDIGCAGLSDQYFTTSAFHGLHGRSITYASGIKLARPELTVIVIMGDGGTGIGGAHLINAARRNVGITVLVFNNLNFGMTGGQHSTTTPQGAVTSTTPGGNLEHPLDICGTVGVNGASYVYRGTSFDKQLSERIREAITQPGFALLDIWELCSAYFMPANKFGRKALDATMEQLGFDSGILHRREVTEYAEAYHAAATASGARAAPVPIDTTFEAALTKDLAITVAGSAGAKVRSAARLFGEAAIRSGLWASQRDDYPVTVKTGHSLSKLVLSPEQAPVDSGGLPDALVLLSDDGLRKAQPLLDQMPQSGVVFTVPEFADVATKARLEVIDPKMSPTRVVNAQLPLVMLTVVTSRLGLFPVDALRRAAEDKPFADKNLESIEAGAALAD